jgi:RNA polymerase sigma-70 factor (ECF subfamily)
VDRFSDEELYEAMGRDERAALGELYDRHARVVYAVAVHVIGERQRAEDLIHDLFLDLARAARRGCAIGHVLRWLVLQVFERTR